MFNYSYHLADTILVGKESQNSVSKAVSQVYYYYMLHISGINGIPYTVP
jgi:hypothetical protein